MTRRHWTIAVIVVAAVGFVWGATQVSVIMDDAYTSLRYADNLVRGRGLVFNPGERVEGFSNFSWTLLLALVLRLGIPALVTAKVLGIGLATVAVAWAVRFAAVLEGRVGPAAVGTALLGYSCLSLAFWSGSGMETALFTLAITAAAERGLPEGRQRRDRWLSTGLLLLAALTRPEGFLFLGLWLLWVLVHDRRGILPHAIFCFVVLLPYFAFKLSYYGDLLPNTYYAKAGVDAAYLRQGLGYAADGLRRYGFWGIGPLLALWSLRREQWRGPLLPIVVSFALYSAYIVLIGGDVLPLHRFWLPLVPLGAAMVALGVAEAARTWRAAPVYATALALWIAAVAIGWRPLHNQMEHEQDTMVRTVRAAEWFQHHYPPGTVAASATAIGALSYLTDFEMVDMLGLTNPEVARNPEPIPGLSSNTEEKRYNGAAVLRRRPEVIFFSTGLRPSAAAEKALFAYPDFHQGYSALHYREGPDDASVRSAFRLRPHAPEELGRSAPTGSAEMIEDFATGLRIYTSGGDMERAIPAFESALEKAPFEFPLAEEWLALSLYRADPESGFVAVLAVAEADSMALLAQRTVAARLLRSDQPEAARPWLQRLTRLEPEEPLGYFGLGMLRAREGDLPGAEQLVRTSLEKYRRDVQAWVLLAEILIAQGRSPEAQAALSEANRISPGHPAVERARRKLR